MNLLSVANRLCLALFAATGTLSTQTWAQPSPAFQTVEAEVDAEAVVRYLLSLQKSNGAFGPAEHNHTDLAWNYPAVHALSLLKQPIPRAAECFANGRGAIYKQKESHNTNWAWDIYQRAQLAAVFGRHGEDGLGLNGEWTLEFTDRKVALYHRIQDAKLRSKAAIVCDVPTLGLFALAITAAGGQIKNPEFARDYLLERQVESGAFVDAYRSEHVSEAAAHIIATYYAVLTLKALGFEVPRQEACAKWLQTCQDASGGFRWHPTAPATSNTPDVWYTWAAAHALHALNAKPTDTKRCAAWINSLQNPDGGFGDRPQWSSRLYSTYYAVHALEVLCGDAKGAISRKRATEQRRVIPEGEFQIFHSHLKSPPGGSDMVEAAHTMGMHLLGIKDNSPDTPLVPVAEARAYALEKGYPLEILSCPEQYPHHLKRHGGHPANHVSNYIYPPDLSPEKKELLKAVDRAGRAGLPWAEFCQQVIRPVRELGTLFYPEIDFEMTNAYMVYDDGLDGGPGYNAVVGALGWPNWDWVRFFPYRERWVGKLPIIADGDAHGDLAKWSERLDRQRMLFIARDNTLPSFLDACQNLRTVCVIRSGTDKSELVFYGDTAAVEYVKRHQKDWQWWQ